MDGCFIFVVRIGGLLVGIQVFQIGCIDGLRNDVVMCYNLWGCGGKKNGCYNSGKMLDGRFYFGFFGNY